jgi:hypothetical protein
MLFIFSRFTGNLKCSEKILTLVELKNEQPSCQTGESSIEKFKTNTAYYQTTGKAWSIFDFFKIKYEKNYPKKVVFLYNSYSAGIKN